jgi:hypothetical protein
VTVGLDGSTCADSTNRCTVSTIAAALFPVAQMDRAAVPNRPFYLPSRSDSITYIRVTRRFYACRNDAASTGTIPFGTFCSHFYSLVTPFFARRDHGSRFRVQNGRIRRFLMDVTPFAQPTRTVVRSLDIRGNKAELGAIRREYVQEQFAVPPRRDGHPAPVGRYCRAVSGSWGGCCYTHGSGLHRRWRAEGSIPGSARLVRIAARADRLLALCYSLRCLPRNRDWSQVAS